MGEIGSPQAALIKVKRIEIRCRAHNSIKKSQLRNEAKKPPSHHKIKVKIAWAKLPGDAKLKTLRLSIKNSLSNRDVNF